MIQVVGTMRPVHIHFDWMVVKVRQCVSTVQTIQYVANPESSAPIYFIVLIDENWLFRDWFAEPIVHLL